MQRSIEISIIAGILSGIIAGIIFSLFYDLPIGIAGGLLTTLIAGGVLFFVMGPLHEMAVKKIAGDASEGSTRVHHVREIEISRSFDESFDLCNRSLDSMSRIRVIEKDHCRGRHQLEDMGGYHFIRDKCCWKGEFKDKSSHENMLELLNNGDKSEVLKEHPLGIYLKAS